MAELKFSERELSDIDAALCVAASQYHDEVACAERSGDKATARYMREQEARLRVLMEKIGSRNIPTAKGA